MKRWLKRVAVTGVTFVALIVGFVLVEHVRGRWILSRRLSALEARGEVLSVTALQPQRPPPDRNGALILLSLTNHFKSVLTNSSAYPPSLRFAAPGRAIVTARLKAWTLDEKATYSWPRIEQELTDAEEILIEMRSAADRPAFDSGFDYRKGFVDFQLGPVVVNVKRAAQGLSIATLHELREGRLDAANSNLCALVKLAVIQKPEPLVICQLVRQACMAIAFNATWQALQTSGWTDAQLAALQSAWTACDLPGDMGKAFEMERAMLMDFYRQIGASRATLDQVIGQREGAEWTGLTGSLPTQGFWLHYIHLPIWRMAWIDQDALRGLEQWEVMIERERLVRSNSWPALPGRPSEESPQDSMPWMVLFQGRNQLGWYDRLRFLFSAESISITDAILLKTLRIQTQQQMVLTAIAAARYQIAQGIEPPDPGALVPRFLPALPRDWMDGKPLRYRLRPGGGFLLYSVGEDCKDDNGDPAPSKPEKKYLQFWDGRDAVWPVAATDAEAEAAMKAKNSSDGPSSKN